MRKFMVLSAALLLSVGFVDFASADEARGFVAKVGVAGVLPDESAKISPIGGTVDISDEYVPAAILGYRFNERISAELFCCLAPHKVKATGTAAGTVDLGEITLFPPIVSVTYKLLTDGKVQPYVGAGVNYTHFFNDDLPRGSIATRIDYDDSFGPALQIGADFPINARWFANIDVKKAWIRSDVTINGAIKADVEIDPVIAFVGVGYKF